MPLKDLSGEDRMDFQQRLARLDLDEKIITNDTLVVESGKATRLDMTGESAIKPLILQTRDISTLRKWIGTPEHAVAARSVAPFAGVLRSSRLEELDLTRALATPKGKTGKAAARRTKSAKSKSKAGASKLSLPELTGVRPDMLLEKLAKLEKADLHKQPELALSSIEKETIRAAARELVHGDAQSVWEFKPVVEQFFVDFQVAVWLFTEIRVEKNATLTLGAGVHNLTAYRMVIEDGGTVRSYGHLHVNVTQMKNPTGGPSVFLPSHVLTGPLRPTHGL